MSDKRRDAEDSLTKKRQFYEDLEANLKSDDDDTPDPGRVSSVEALKKAATRKQQVQSTRDASNGLPRSISASDLIGTKTKSFEAKQQHLSRAPASSDPNDKLPASLQTRHTFAGSPSKTSTAAAPSTSAVSKATGKRKRETSIKESIPIERQIFKGLNFYFFPNTDANPARKLRIAKALDFGAAWIKDFDDSVTHVIVDKKNDFDQVLKFLKKDRLPAAVKVVSENYPAECISFKALLDPFQLQFKVKRYVIPNTSRPASSGSDRSVQLKPAGKSIQSRRLETPVAERRVHGPTNAPPLDDHDSEAEEQPPRRAEKAPASIEFQSTEELDVAIRKARNLAHVSLDTEDEASSRPSSSDGPTTDDEQQDSSFGFDKKKKSKLQELHDKFQCMQKPTSANDTPNAATVAILQQMADYYSQVGDEWRTRAYRKAISTLRNHPTKVWTTEEALSLPQIGERLATKIEEIAFTNRLRRLDSAKVEPGDQILQTFMQVYGAGFAQASKWVSAGYTTLDELLQKADLANNQRIGIEHYEDFNSRIPRSEVEQHGKIVRKTLQKIDPAFEVIIGGSYRRGSETSGDIDCIITRPNTGAAYIRQIVLDLLVPALLGKKFLVAELAATSKDDGSKWHGASTIPTTNPKSRPNPWRRIDLLLVPSDEIGAALIYFTGNDIFNRSLRLLASTKAMRLNQRGLYKDVIRGKDREKFSEGTLVEGKDEKKIFEALGVPWRPPEHRIC